MKNFWQMRWLLNVAASLLGASLLFGDHCVGDTKTHINLLNKLNPSNPLDVYWISVNESLVYQGQVSASSPLHLNTHVSHGFLAFAEDAGDVDISSYTHAILNPNVTTFMIEEYDKSVTFLRGENETLIASKDNYIVSYKERFMESVSACVAKERSTEEDDMCLSDLDQSFILNSDTLGCISRDIASQQFEQKDKLNRIGGLLRSVGKHLTKYTCADPLEETPAIDDPRTLRVKRWNEYDVQVFLEDEDARIMLLHDFIPEEDPITMLYKKAYAFANDETGYNLSIGTFVQEGFNVISYGHGDEYISHCDGSCDGNQYKTGGRVATFVFYCAEAELGGGTTFSNVDVYLKGKRGQAAFFSYLGPDMKMDMGKTQHSGCPVLKGRKWIATLWMRKGLSEGNSWRNYDPLGNAKSS